MAWADLNDRQAVLEALDEFDEIGREAFLAKYGFGHAYKYVLVRDGKEYDAKAIIGAAHGYQFPEEGPLSSQDFSSSARNVKLKLIGMGFEVKEVDRAIVEPAEVSPTRPRMTVVASSDLKNWEIGKQAHVWGIRKKATAALAKGRALRPGDRIAVYISGNGIVAFLEVTAHPQEPWPANEPDPWQDGSEYQLKIPVRVEEEFSPPLSLQFDGAFAKSVRIDKFSLLGWGSIDDYQVERIREIARGEVSSTENVPLMRAWFLVHSQGSHAYKDQEGEAYHYPSSIANAKQIDPGDAVICYRTGGKSPDAQKIFGVGRVKDVVSDGSKHRFAVFDRYLKIDPPVGLDEVGGDPRLNWSHSISSFPPDRLRKLLDLAGIESIDDLPEIGEVVLPNGTSDVLPTSPDEVDLSKIVEKFRKALSESNITFGERHELVTRNFIASLVTKPFVILTGLSGSGKTRIAQHLGDWFGEGRALLIPVRPDWTGGEALFGYEDALDQSPNRAWFVPPVLEFMLRASRNPEHPHLLVLDEMNLAHVERYFGDFLSGLESGKALLPNLFLDFGAQDGRWRMKAGHPRTLPLPRNVFVVGTVNVDETTYMFSPKVLDRANTFEFRVETSELNPTITRPNSTAPADDATLRGLLALAKDDSFQEAHPASFQGEFAARLVQLHALLAEGDFEFGHRVMSEGMRFASVYEAAGGTWPETLDLQVLQKVLPKLHGSYKRLGATLQRVAHFAFSPDGSFSPEFEPLEQDTAEAFLPLSFAKARRMYRNLKAYQFTSFTE